jgi:hypothetical protein
VVTSFGGAAQGGVALRCMHACVLTLRSLECRRTIIKVSNPDMLNFGVDCTQPEAAQPTRFHIKSQQQLQSIELLIHNSQVIKRVNFDVECGA